MEVLLFLISRHGSTHVHAGVHTHAKFTHAPLENIRHTKHNYRMIMGLVFNQ